MSVATEFPPEVYIPPSARWSPSTLATVLPFPAASAAAALDAEVVDLDRWRHHSYDRPAIELFDPHSDRNGRQVGELAGSAAAPVRLTRRGVAVLGCMSALAALATVAIAWLCAPAGPQANGSPAAPATVAAQSGDSLWSIARQVAPSRDPRAEVDQLRALNHLSNDVLTPGQVLRTR
jgi:hypothetical protein